MEMAAPKAKRMMLSIADHSQGFGAAEFLEPIRHSFIFYYFMWRPGET
jgi:hypothetical protein